MLTNEKLTSFEGKHSLLNDSSQNRIQPIQKCGQVAYANNYNYFAISMGQCYTGTDNINDFQRFGESTLCRNGTGGDHLIDVYSIERKNTFLSSIENITACGADYCTNDDDLCLVNSSSTGLHAAYMCILSFLLLFTILM